LTCWVQKTTRRQSDALFQDGRRRHLVENSLQTVFWPYIDRFWWNLVYKQVLTCWVQKTTRRLSHSIFQDGRRGLVEKTLQTFNSPFIDQFGWTLVHEPILTNRVQKTQRRLTDAIFQNGRGRFVRKPYRLYLDHWLTDFQEVRYTNHYWNAESEKLTPTVWRHFPRWLPQPCW
jgi:hypothetical protein